jgi:hypothetical protein
MDIFLIVVVVAVLVIALAGLVALSDIPRERAERRAREAEQDVIRISRETQDEIIKRAMWRALKSGQPGSVMKRGGEDE